MRRLMMPMAVLTVSMIAGAACTIEVGADERLATGRFDRTLEVAGPVELDVRTGSGSVTVRRGGASRVQVTGHVRARRGVLNGGRSAAEQVAAVQQEPPIAQEGNAVRLGEAARPVPRGVSISFEVIVPAETTLRASSGSGRIVVESVDGPVDARTGSGSISLGRVAGAVMAQTGSGSIDVLAAGRGLTARTGSGSIRGRDLAGPVRADSGSGRIEIVYAAAGSADLSTGSGSIAVAGFEGPLRAQTGSGGISVDGVPTAAWQVDAGSGGIRLRLPAGAAFDLDAHSSSGSIRTSHPLVASGVSRNRLEGAVRGGGPRLLLRTGSGSIRVD